MIKTPMVIGHRGAMGHETENTLASVQKAMDLGVDMIEIDVFKIKGGEILVFHDVEVDKLTDGSGKIEDYTLEEAKELIVDGGHSIPTLEEVLQLIDRRTSINIELKGAGTSQSVHLIIQSYMEQHGWTQDQFLISSFNWEELKSYRKYNESIAIAVLTENDPLDAIPVARELKAEAINPYYLQLNEQNVNAIHRAGFKVYTWTVNTPNAIRRMKKIGVDGIFSDYPERVK